MVGTSIILFNRNRWHKMKMSFRLQKLEGYSTSLALWTLHVNEWFQKLNTYLTLIKLMFGKQIDIATLISTRHEKILLNFAFPMQQLCPPNIIGDYWYRPATMACRIVLPGHSHSHSYHTLSQSEDMGKSKSL